MISHCCMDFFRWFISRQTTQMEKLYLLLLILTIGSCKQQTTAPTGREQAEPLPSYAETKKEILEDKQAIIKTYPHPDFTDRHFQQAVVDCWLINLNRLYEQWSGTSWDFNGTSTEPGTGPIACGYFVTTLLKDMGYPVNRVKLATCASSEMMQTLTPGQRFIRLNNLSLTAFTDSLQRLKKGVYIIGLDFHTGFIVNKGSNAWFIHSNYINRKGVMKEEVGNSAALKASKTRWLVCLTGDRKFIAKWLDI